MKNKKDGFTLIEMTVVLFIISLLILIIVPNISGQKKHANKIHILAMSTMIQGQVDALSDETNNKNIDFTDLISEGYLTDKQVKQAESDGIKIENNKVIED